MFSQRTLVYFPAPSSGYRQSPVTLAPGNLELSSDLCRHCLPPHTPKDKSSCKSINSASQSNPCESSSLSLFKSRDDPQYFSCHLEIPAKAPSRQRGCQQNTFSRELIAVMATSGMSPTGRVSEHTWSPDGGTVLRGRGASGSSSLASRNGSLRIGFEGDMSFCFWLWHPAS